MKIKLALVVIAVAGLTSTNSQAMLANASAAQHYVQGNCEVCQEKYPRIRVIPSGRSFCDSCSKKIVSEFYQIDKKFALAADAPEIKKGEDILTRKAEELEKMPGLALAIKNAKICREALHTRLMRNYLSSIVAVAGLGFAGYKFYTMKDSASAKDVMLYANLTGLGFTAWCTASKVVNINNLLSRDDVKDVNNQNLQKRLKSFRNGYCARAVLAAAGPLIATYGVDAAYDPLLPISFVVGSSKMTLQKNDGSIIGNSMSSLGTALLANTYLEDWGRNYDNIPKLKI